MVTVAALLAFSLAFGAGDQYLGSPAGRPWAHEVSLLSAPWLLIAFVGGAMQREPKRGAVLGVACTFAALLGYGVMTLSPMEGAEFTQRAASGLVRSQTVVIIGGVLTGPLYGWLGTRWREGSSASSCTRRSRAFVLEPAARVLAGTSAASRLCGSR